ncbi:hypothetical protein [Salinibacterium sp. M195]|uniref:hypothetical protein n=1 Tax=Salinibacterium sp. M195 TaxID=2583374 RepID=UPI001C62AA40|nr:hypothetical protein [Salinibacterium sp. M195]QYH35300.1 hypothetical protein FFT87_04670 [Salinibacterium sp. M195]
MTDHTPNDSVPEEVSGSREEAPGVPANSNGQVSPEPTEPPAETVPPAPAGRPAETVPPASTGQPMPPVQPPAVAAAKSGMPGWAWALIIGGGVVLIGMVIAVVIIVVIISGALNRGDCSLPGSCGQGLPPVTSEEPADEPADGSAERITLDGNADFGGAPVWGVPVDPAWEVLVFDQDGINSFRDPESGCYIVTSQRQTAVSNPADGDIAASEAAMQEEIAALMSITSTIEELDSGTLDIAVATQSSGISIEFLTSAQLQTVSAGDMRVSEILVRGMPSSGSIMSTLVLCSANTYETGESPFSDIASQLTVNAGF